MDQVIEELSCPICLQLFECPIILPCSHVLCQQPCADRLFHNGFVKCPVCRDSSFVIGGLSTLPRVISLEHIIERYRDAVARATVVDLHEIRVSKEMHDIGTGTTESLVSIRKTTATSKRIF